MAIRVLSVIMTGDLTQERNKKRKGECAMAEYRILGNGKKILIETPRRVSAVHAVSVIEAVGSAVGPGVGAVTAGAAGMAGSAVAAIMGEARKPHPRFERAKEEGVEEKIDDATGEVVPGAGAELSVAAEAEAEAESFVGGELPLGDGKPEEWGFRVAEPSEESAEVEEAETSEGGELPLGDGKPEEGKKRRRRR